MRSTLSAAALCLAATAATAAPDVQPLLDAGDFEAAAARLEEALKADPGDHDARLALGVTTFLAGVEELAHAAWAHGLRDPASGAAGLVGVGTLLPMKPNPEPLETSAADVDAALEAFGEALAATDAALAPIGDAEARMSLRPGTVRMDLDGDGVLERTEGLWRFFEAVRDPWGGTGFDDNGNPLPPDPDAPPSPTEEAAEGFVLGLDTGDAYWLRGYAHLLGGVVDLALGYDGGELFGRAGHLFFDRTTGLAEHPWLAAPGGPGGFDVNSILDAVAAVHLLSQPVRDAGRVAAAREKFLAVADLSRRSWASILAETDDDREWLPAPGQASVIGVGIEQEQVDAWLSFLDEAEKLLDGELLIPFWRGADRPQGGGGEGGVAHPSLGVNLKRVFTEPTRFDLILWVQGTQAAPYLEEGPQTEPDFWLRLNEAFEGNLPGFAVWIN